MMHAIVQSCFANWSEIEAFFNNFSKFVKSGIFYNILLCILILSRIVIKNNLPKCNILAPGLCSLLVIF